LYFRCNVWRSVFWGERYQKESGSGVAPTFMFTLLGAIPLFITGGTMIVSAVIALLCGQRPTKKEILSIILSLAGMLMLVFIP
jgi:drug/metabolite transporter (DMT)-like permease